MEEDGGGTAALAVASAIAGGGTAAHLAAADLARLDKDGVDRTGMIPALLTDCAWERWHGATSRAAYASAPPPTQLPIKVKVLAECQKTRARALDMVLPHGPLRTPVFMPVGTQGTIKGLLPKQMVAAVEKKEEAGQEEEDEEGNGGAGGGGGRGDAEGKATQSPPPVHTTHDIILGNTYHLALRPGTALLRRQGGLHSFMRWPNNILTDSGGFQMVSLLALADITERGVHFQSPADGTQMLLTPEESINLQNDIGSDVMMALDDVVSSVNPQWRRFEIATYRTLRWIDRCIDAHRAPRKQCLFGILQGGLDTSPGGLREICIDGMKRRDAYLSGYAVGGLAGGEDKNQFWRVVAQATPLMPRDKPRYLMGVGFPLDLVVCVALGIDMFDCVYPTRTARFGTALVSTEGGLIKLKSAACARDVRPIAAGCACEACAGGYTRAHLYRMLRDNESIGTRLVTLHNLQHMKSLTAGMRAAIIEGRFPEFCRSFMESMYGSTETDTYPPWAVDALRHAGVDLTRRTESRT